MSKQLITVVSANYNDSIFKELMLYAFNKLTFNTFRVIFCDNGSNYKNIEILRKLDNNYDNLTVIYQNQSKAGSHGHGEALDKMIHMVDTEYTVVMDSDCTFLMKNWDEYILNEIDEKIKIIGTSSPPDRAGIRIGGGDFPLPFATLFETAIYKSLNISCKPGDVINGEDTCWEWKTKYNKNGYLGKTFITKNTRDYKDGPFGALTGIEEYYTDNGKLIASHFGRGSSGGLAKYTSKADKKYYRLMNAFPYLENIYAKYRGEKEMQLWIEKCNNIIDCLEKN